MCVYARLGLTVTAFRFDGLITPTLKAAGSNPVGRTKKATLNDKFKVAFC